MRVVRSLPLAFALTSWWSATAQAFPLGLGYEIVKDKVHVTDKTDDTPGSADFEQTHHTLSLLDYSGLLCAGFQNVHAQSEARSAAMDRAASDSSVKPGDTVTYSYRAVLPQQGTACGVKLHNVRDEGDVGGASVKLTGWTAFGGLTAPFKENPELFWKLWLMVDVREFRVEGGEKSNLMGMPFEYELGKIVNIDKVGGFFVSGMVGYELIFWLLKTFDENQMPTSFLRYGATVGYQTPIEALQVRLTYKNTDQGFDERGFKEKTTSFGVFYQM